MTNKISFVSGAGALLMLSLLAPAQTATKAPASPDAPTLGVMEGLLNFCGKVNPQAASTYEQLRNQVTSGKSAEELSRTRNSKDYKDALAKISDRLAQMPVKAAVAACSAK